MTQDDNGEKAWGGKRAMAHTWEQFDALPRGVKRLFWYAPYDYTARGAYRAWRAGRDMRESVARQARAMARDVRRESLALYGQEQDGFN